MARILIADDNEADRLVLHAFLERTGHEIIEAQDGEGALREYLRARMRAHPIQVVITDLQMPGVHGLHIIMLLRDLSPRPAIVAVSGTGGEQLEMAHAIGADAMLTKPVDPTELLDAVDQALARAPDYEPADGATEPSSVELDPEPVPVEEAAPDTAHQGAKLGGLELEP
ncbi:MAG: response regulator, partial [Rhodothermales bacterium]|nr:response regulator [Rhodothermales bacterium]